MSIYRDRKSGRWRFEFDRYIEGERVRRRVLLPAGFTRAQADAFDRKEGATLYALATGTARPRHDVDEAVRRYLSERVPDLKSGSNVEREIKALEDWYTRRPIEDLPAICAEYAQDQLGALAPATIKNRIAYLRAACRWAWKQHALTPHDPTVRMQLPTVRNERHVYIDRRQMLTLARACDDHATRIAIRVAFYSGMRLGEIQRVEVAGRVLVLPDTKNNDRRAIPAHPRLATCLDYLPLAAPDRQLQHAFSKARQAVGLAHVHFHDLRHSAASEMVNHGVDLYSIGKVLGHRDPRSTARYSHLNHETLADAVGKIGGRKPAHTDRPKAA